MGDVTNIQSFANDSLGDDSVASGLFADIGPGRARPLCSGKQVPPHLNRFGTFGELRESDTLFREFVEEYAPSVLRVACTILGNRAKAEEIARDTFVTAWFFTKGRSMGRSHFTRVYRIVVKECFRRLTAKRPSAENVVSRRYLQRELLNKTLAQISDEDRCLLLLRELEDYSVTQLSEVTGLDEFAIRTDSSRRGDNWPEISGFRLRHDCGTSPFCC